METGGDDWGPDNREGPSQESSGMLPATTRRLAPFVAPLNSDPYLLNSCSAPYTIVPSGKLVHDVRSAVTSC